MMEKILLGSILHMTKGKKPKAQATQQEADFLPYIDIKAFEKHIVDNFASPEKCLLCQEGDILIVCDGARSGLTGRAITGVVGSTLALISADGCSNDYLFYFLQSLYTLLNTKQKGTGTPHLNPDILKKAQLVVPPLPEQERIVAKIEELFSQLDAAVAELKSVKEKVVLFRNSVIDSSIAFSDMRPIKECITTIGQGWSPKCDNENVTDDEQWAVIKTTAVQARQFCFDENKKLPSNLSPREQHEIKIDDILITRAGPRSRCGICCLVKKTKQRLLNCDKVYCLKVDKNIALPEYLELVLNSPTFLKEIELCKTGGSDSGLNLTQSRFLKMEIPVPDLPQQQSIIEQIDAKLSVCTHIEQIVDTALQQAAVLRQSILKQAFEGNL